MSSQVSCRVEPVKTDEKLAGLAAHIDRTQIKPQEHIDATRTPFNRVLVGSGDVFGDVKAMIGKYKKAHKDTTPCAELVLTAKREWFDEISTEWRKGVFTPQMQNWIDSNLQFLKDAYPGLVSADMHLDEEAPHIHAMVVPLVTYRISYRRGSKEVTRIAYNRVFGDTQQVLWDARQKKDSELTKLGRLQTAYANALKSTGLERGVKNINATHVTPAEHRKRIKQKTKPLPKVKTKVPEPESFDAVKEKMGIETTRSKAVKQRAKEEKARLDAGLKQLEVFESKSIELEIVQAKAETQKDALIEKDRIIDELKKLSGEVRGIDIVAVLRKAGVVQSHADQSSWLTPAGAVIVEGHGRYRDVSGKLKKGAIDLTIDLFGCKYNEALLWLKSKFSTDAIVNEAKKRAEERARSTLAGGGLDHDLDLVMIERSQDNETEQKPKPVQHSRLVRDRDHEHGLSIS